MSDETRSQNHEIEIEASTEAVWRALTDSEEITRWYVHSADIDAREGGLFKISWGEGMDGGGKITTFAPEERLKIDYLPMEGSPPLETPIGEDWTIETKDGKTVLRMVMSGIPATEDWDWFYDGTNSGWGYFFTSLKHYLEKHPGTPRDHIVSHITIPGTPEEAWPVIFGPDGLGMDDDLTAGRRYSATTSLGDQLAGEVLLANRPERLLLTVEQLNDGLLGATLGQMGPANFLYLSLATFGLDAETLDGLRERFEAIPRRLFAETESPAEAFNEMVDGLGIGIGDEEEAQT